LPPIIRTGTLVRMAQLSVNVDHVATVRQARRTYEPDPVWAAVEAQLGGADGVTMHLREDRRHIQDHDLERAKGVCQVKLNLEMAATDEMTAIACRVKPHMAMLVPEGRLEVTTEGGLDVVGQLDHLREVVTKLKDAGMTVSAFIDAEADQVDAAAEAGFSVCEVHTGPYAQAFHESGDSVSHPRVEEAMQRVAMAGRLIVSAGMQFNAGHALNYLNVRPIAQLPGLGELHIGHAIVSRAVFIGLRTAVSDMKRLIGPELR
jgi:pyridoxine 5-phosphate synthase